MIDFIAFYDNADPFLFTIKGEDPTSFKHFD